MPARMPGSLAGGRWPGAPLLLALTAALLLFRLGAVPLLGPDEPRYARVAVEMLGLARPRAMVAAAAFFGLATLAKGPLGIVLPALVAGGYLLVTREREAARPLFSPAAWAVFAAVALPWYALILRAQGRAFVEVF